MVWLAAFAYTGQIFCDFSGYSDMAIGLARLLGFRLKANFNLPYCAHDIADFWRRWHISLSTWMRDYVYIPLGGSQQGEFKKHVNLFATMLICGVWHGANWQFVLWGGYHGILLVMTHFLKKVGLRTDGAYKLVSVPITFLLVVLGWVLFRAENLGLACQMYARMFAYQQGQILSPYLLICAAFAFALLLLGHICARLLTKNRLIRVPAAATASAICAMLLCICVLYPEQRTQFIYFQF
jgi:alginate O-acetyltransferase complex protein AlgI